MLDHLNNKVSEITRQLIAERSLIESLVHQLNGANKRLTGLEIDLKVYNSAIEDLRDPSSLEDNAKEMLSKILAKLPANTVTAVEAQSKANADIRQELSPIFHRALTDPLHDALDQKPAEVDSNPIASEQIHFVTIQKPKQKPTPMEDPKVFEKPTQVVSNKKKGNKKNKTAPKFGKKGFGNKTVMPKKDK